MIRILGLMTCFNRKEKTINAINKLINGNSEVEFSFIVVDDNSRDDTVKALRQFTNVTIINGNGNLFYSGGMRKAIEKALDFKYTYDYCLLFNDDVDFYENSIDKLSKRGSKSIWVGPTCDYKGELSYGGIIKTSIWHPSFKIIKSEGYNGVKCDTFNANCVLIPWNIFKNIGNMDKMYSHSLGDFDYGFKAKKLGYEIKVSHEYVGICCDNPVKGSWRDNTLSRKRRLKLKEDPKGLPRKEWFYYLRKNYSLITAIAYSIIPYIRILIRR